MKKKAGTEKRDFIWYSLRIGFSLMCALFIASFFVNFWVINILFLVLMIFNLVVSIIHLFKHKGKIFAIIALIITVLLILFYAYGLFLIYSA